MRIPSKLSASAVIPVTSIAVATFTLPSFIMSTATEIWRLLWMCFDAVGPLVAPFTTSLQIINVQLRIVAKMRNGTSFTIRVSEQTRSDLMSAAGFGLFHQCVEMNTREIRMDDYQTFGGLQIDKTTFALFLDVTVENNTAAPATLTINGDMMVDILELVSLIRSAKGA